MNPHKPRYRTTNWPEYNRSLQNRGNLTVWLSPDLPWLGHERTGANGRPPVYTDAAIQTVLTLKVLFKLALRQARGLVCSVLNLLGLDWPVPCFSTVSRRQATLTVNIPIRRRAEPLHLLVDSTGIKICGEGEWKVKKHGAEYRRAWRKVHLAIDAKTLDIRAVEMTDHRQGDAAQMEELLSQLDPDVPLGSVSGDGAYDTRGFYRSVHARSAEVIVPPRRNGRPWKDRANFAQARNDTLAAAKHLGWRLWKKWSGYHRRSLVETTMGRFKLLGERLAARQPERQVAEVHVRCAILNTFNRLGMPVTVALA
jgi:hypothetical protein